MTLEKAQKNLSVMMSANKALMKLPHGSAKRILGILLKFYAETNGERKEELNILNFCIRRLENLSKDDALATIKYLVDLYYGESAETEPAQCDDSEEEVGDYDEFPFDELQSKEQDCRPN